MYYNILLRCPHCGRVYRVRITKNGYETDFGDAFPVKGDKTKCFCCRQTFSVPENKIVSENWIIDLVYKVKGN